MAFLVHVAAAVVAAIGAHGACADDLAALPESLHPDVVGYQLECVTEPIWFARGGRWVRAMVDPDTRVVTLNGLDDHPIPGMVLAHESCHLLLGHRPGPGVETEANECAAAALAGVAS